MIDDSTYSQLLETSWRRKLTPSEEVELRDWLATHPEDQAAWEAEAGLNEFLGLLPDAVVASNFTERVLKTLEVEEAASSRRQRRGAGGWWRRLVPRLALVGLTAAAGALWFEHHRITKLRAEVAKDVRTVSIAVSEMPPSPSPEFSADFDVIRLSAALVRDDRLLALLK